MGLYMDNVSSNNENIDNTDNKNTPEKKRGGVFGTVLFYIFILCGVRYAIGVSHNWFPELNALKIAYRLINFDLQLFFKSLVYAFCMDNTPILITVLEYFFKREVFKVLFVSTLFMFMIRCYVFCFVF